MSCNIKMDFGEKEWNGADWSCLYEDRENCGRW